MINQSARENPVGALSLWQPAIAGDIIQGQRFPLSCLFLAKVSSDLNDEDLLISTECPASQRVEQSSAAGETIFPSLEAKFGGFRFSLAKIEGKV